MTAPDRNHPPSVSLVVQTSFLGDMVLTTPLLRSLAERGVVDVLATPAGASLLNGHPAVRDVIVYDKRGRDRGVGGLARTAARVRQREDGTPRRTQVAYMAQGSARSAALAMLAGIRRRVGFDTSSGRSLYTERVPYLPDRHHCERLWSLAHPGTESFPPESRSPSLAIPSDAVARVDGLLAEFGVQAGEVLVALAPGSVWATKRWPYYPELASGLAGRVRLALIGSADEQPMAAEVETAVKATGAPPVVNAAGRLSLLESAELIGRCAALVSNDSLPQHLASAVGTPTVTVFGPTVPEFGFGPLAPGSVSVGVTDLDCRPCDRHGPRVCPLKHWRCMRDLESAAVLNALAPLLSNRPDA